MGQLGGPGGQGEEMLHNVGDLEANLGGLGGHFGESWGPLGRSFPLLGSLRADLGRFLASGALLDGLPDAFLSFFCLFSMIFGTKIHAKMDQKNIQRHIAKNTVFPCYPP